MYLPTRYMNIEEEIDTIADTETKNNNYPIPSKSRLMNVPFYFIDKDPVTGRRRSTPIMDEDSDILKSIEFIQKIGCVRLNHMYLVEIISSRGSINEFNVRTTHANLIEPIMMDYLNKPQLNIIRQSRICENISAY